MIYGSSITILKVKQTQMSILIKEIVSVISIGVCSLVPIELASVEYSTFQRSIYPDCPIAALLLSFILRRLD